MQQAIHNKIQDHFTRYPTKTYAKGTIVIDAGQEPPGVLWLQDGIIEQYDITPAGNKITVNIFKPPAFFPMSWAINRTPNSYIFAAQTAVSVRLAEADETVSFLRQNPDVLYDLLGRVYRGTDGILRRLVLASQGIASNRLVLELLIAAYRFGTPEAADEGTYFVQIQQSELAVRSGLARETVSRELQKLAKRRLVRRVEGGLVVDMAALEAQLDWTP